MQLNSIQLNGPKFDCNRANHIVQMIELIIQNIQSSRIQWGRP